MHISQIGHSAKEHFCLISANSAKRWGRWFVFAWIAMSLSTALLPCREVLAAVAANKTALHSVCGQPANQALDSNGERKTKACLNVAAPVRAPVERLIATTDGNLIHPAVLISSQSYIRPPPPARAFAPAYRAAPPPVAVFLRSSRLLI